MTEREKGVKKKMAEKAEIAHTIKIKKLELEKKYVDFLIKLIDEFNTKKVPSTYMQPSELIFKYLKS